MKGRQHRSCKDRLIVLRGKVEITPKIAAEILREAGLGR